MYRSGKQVRFMKNQKGFTLVELMVVMVILGILAALGLGSFRSSQMKGRDNQRKGELRSVAAAFELYYNDYGTYPNDNGSGKITACGSGGTTVCDWGNEFKDKNDTLYMVELPIDPLVGYTYYYDVLGTNNTSFQLYARLENTEDPGVSKSGGNPQVYGGLSCGLKVCNYGIASTNTTPGAGRTLVNE